jgi:hypothetical protein
LPPWSVRIATFSNAKSLPHIPIELVNARPHPGLLKVNVDMTTIINHYEHINNGTRLQPSVAVNRKLEAEQQALAAEKRTLAFDQQTKALQKHKQELIEQVQALESKMAEMQDAVRLKENISHELPSSSLNPSEGKSRDFE